MVVITVCLTICLFIFRSLMFMLWMFALLFCYSFSVCVFFSVSSFVCKTSCFILAKEIFTSVSVCSLLCEIYSYSHLYFFFPLLRKRFVHQSLFVSSIVKYISIPISISFPSLMKEIFTSISVYFLFCERYQYSNLHFLSLL